MAEYIDREALLKEIDEDYYPMNWTNSEAEIQADNDYALYRNVIEAQPTADVVPVVRCKDCKHFNIGVLGLNWCDTHSYDELIECKENDYCSYGERRCEK